MARSLLSLPVLVALAACGSTTPEPVTEPVPVDEAEAVTTGPDAVPPTEADARDLDEALSDARVMELGREYTAMLFENRIDELWAVFDDDMRAASESLESFRGTTDQIFNQLGTETTLVNESIEDIGTEQGAPVDLRVYRRVGQYAGAGGANAELLIAMRPDGRIAGLFIRPAQ